MNNILNFTRNKLEEELIKIGEKKYRATQIFEGIYQKKVVSFDEMSNLSKDFIKILKEKYYIDLIKIIKKEEGNDVIKYLFELNDNLTIEAVLMFHDYGNSLCVSTQVGCNMGCLFCESGRLRKIRNLTTAEMVSQFLMIEKDLNKRISHVVLMGIGEPFDNYENVIDFVRILIDNKGINLGVRHITISTSGLIPGIKKLMNEDMQVNLAISLHAPNDKIRNALMPINRVYNLDKLINTIKEYISKTNRRVTFEYVLLDGVNDSEELALELVSLLKGINCYVNLIPYNETSNLQFKKSEKMKILQFYDILKKHNINVTIRRELGQNVSAACGQLRSLDL